MLVHVKNLSIWEIAHYWHDCDPRESTTHHVPLKVRDTLLVLAMSYSKRLMLRVDQDKLYMLDAYNKSARLTGRYYRHMFRKAIDSKTFGKRFFSNMFITRSQLARWCVEHKEPFPKFWFPDNDKFPYDATGDLHEEISVGGRYKLVLLYDDTKKLATDSDFQQSATNGQQETSAATVNENAVKAANAKHAPTNNIKSRFIDFYLAEGKRFPSRAESARHFFDSLEAKEMYLFAGKESAVRTFTDALREHLKSSSTSE